MIKNIKSRNLMNYLMVFLVLTTSVLAKAPAVGTIIKNQASATYRDSSGIEQTTTSNLVETVVQQVGAFTLEQDQSRYGIEGQVVSFPHVLTNTGNGDDSFSLDATDFIGADDYDFDDFTIYPDINKDGIADSNVPITDTGVLAADEAFYFVVAATVPVGVLDTTVGRLTVQGKSAFSDTIETNTDEAIVSDDAVIRVTKSISASSGATGSGPYMVTLTYSNPSTVDASDVTLIDALPAGMNYIAGSGRWSRTGSGVALTDILSDGAQGTSPDTVFYCAYDTGCTSQVEAVVSSVVSGDSGTISFSIMLDAGLSVSTLINTGEFSYNNGTIVVPSQETNPVPVDIISQPGVIANGSQTSSDDVNFEVVTQTTASIGSTVAFDNVIWNTGNTTDFFDISIDQAAATFPTGTTFALYKSDGFTPLLDNDNSGEVDTGPIAAGEFYIVVLKARLPISADAVGTAGYDVSKTATSAIDTSISNTVTDHLDEITGSVVDLTNNAAASDPTATGVGVGPIATAQTVVEVAPGSSGVFKLYVNTGDIADSFDLAYSTDASFASMVLPDDWTAAFYRDAGTGDCSTLGAVTTNTGVIAPNSAKLICAQVEITSGVAFTNTPVSIYFRVESVLTGASDIKHDAVLMTASKKLILEPDNQAITEPGSSVTYMHRLSNPGNTVYTDLTLASSDTLAADGWTSILYEDTDGNGVLSGTDQPVGTYTLNPGESMTVFAKVFAPGTAPYGASNLTDIIATGSTDTGTVVVETVSAKDVTTVAATSMAITKRQAPDADCDGSEDTAFSFDAFTAQPNTCVLYNLTATNTSASSSHNVRIDDLIPEFTSHFTDSGALPTISAGSLNATNPAEGGTGIIGGNAGVVAAGGSVTLIFGVLVE